MTPDWGKILGAGILAACGLGLVAIAMSNDDDSETDGIPVTENPPTDVTDTDDEDDDG